MGNSLFNKAKLLDPELEAPEKKVSLQEKGSLLVKAFNAVEESNWANPKNQISSASYYTNKVTELFGEIKADKNHEVPLTLISQLNKIKTTVKRRLEIEA